MTIPRLPPKWMFVLTVLLVAAANFASAEENEIHWYKDLKEAVAVAQQTNKPMMIDFWADWCSPCKFMDAEVYSNPSLVSAFNQKMIGVRIHYDLQPEMVRKFNVPALPYLVFTNSYGSELMHHSGMLEAGDLTAVVRAFPTDVSELNRLDRILQEDKNDFDALLRMGRELRAAGFFKASNDYYERASKQDQGKENPAQRESILFEMGLNSLQLQDGKKAAETFKRCLKEFPHSEHKPEFLLGLARAHILNDKTREARGLLNSLITQYPQSEISHKAREILNSM